MRERTVSRLAAVRTASASFLSRQELTASGSATARIAESAEDRANEPPFLYSVQIQSRSDRYTDPHQMENKQWSEVRAFTLPIEAML